MYEGIDTTFGSARSTACFVDDPALVCTLSDLTLWSIHSASCSVPDSANLDPATVVLLLSDKVDRCCDRLLCVYAV